jgi:bifunctional non-homologous end joining protein LigD
MAARRRLAEYDRKRDFTRTSEPSGKARAKAKAPARKPTKKKSAPKSAARRTAKKRTARKSPAKKKAAPKKAPIFVVQHHKASHDHHDFRLEHDGVLLSWAVPKHVPTKFGEKRLAIQVEDHPLDYATFQGTIPKGNYGAGTVKTYDIGYWEPEGDIEEMLNDGKLSFTLRGVRMKGDWTLVRMQPREGKKETKPQWLLMRHHQEKGT